MAKLIMMKGLPASGKSYNAREIVGNGKAFARVNRDDLRAMLYGRDSVWSGKKEEVVIRAEKAMVKAALEEGFNCVVDDTNLSKYNADMWQSIADVLGHSFEERFVDTPIDLCIHRDFWRSPGRVGRAVIENVALRYGLLPNLDERRPKITIWDVDGTLLDISHRCGWNETTGKRIHPSSLKHLSHKDTINQPIADWFNAMKQDTHAFIVSGRGTDEAITTQDMLSKFGVVPDRMFMRNGGDNRVDKIVKREILDRILARYGNDCIEFVVDDRPSVVDMWKSQGIKVYPVNQASWEGIECLSQPAIQS